MKRIALLLIFSFSISVIFAQTQGVQKPFSHFLEEKQKSDEELKKPEKENYNWDWWYNIKLNSYKKTMNDPEFWMERGTVFRKIYMYAGNNLNYGMPMQTVMILKGEPEQKLKQGNKEIWKYESYQLTAEGGKIVKWELMEDYDGQPYDSAMVNYKKAFRVDEESNKTEDIQTEVIILRNFLQDEGIMYFSNDNLEKAYTSFQRSANIYNMPQMEGQDTSGYNVGLIYYYGAHFANQINKPQKAIDLYKKLMAYNNEVEEAGYPENKFEEKNSYRMLAATYKKVGKIEKQKEILDKAYEKYGTEKNILLDMTQYYLEQNEFEKALEFLNKSLEQDPDNPLYLYVKGNLYDNFKRQKYVEMDKAKKEIERADSLRRKDSMEVEEYNTIFEENYQKIQDLWEPANENMNKAAKFYKKALEEKPDYSEAKYNLGALYYNKAAQVLSMAMLIPTGEQDRYDNRKELANKLFKKAKPYILEAKKQDPHNIAILQTLSTIHAKLGEYDKVREVKEEIEEAKQKQDEEGIK